MNMIRTLDRSLSIYVARAAIISLSATSTVALLIHLGGMYHCGELQEERSWLHVVMSGMILSPILESALLTAAVRWVDALSGGNRNACIVIPAIAASAVHGVFCVWWGIAVMPAFIVYARAVVDYHRESWLRGCLVTLLIHVVHNVVAIVIARVLG